MIELATDTRRSPVILALDIGGTRARVGIVNMDGVLLERTEVFTGWRGPDEVVRDLTTQISTIRETWDARALGISNVGLVGQDRGRDLSMNFPTWRPEHLKQVVQDTGLPHAVVNDVKAAALAECRLGKTKDADPGLYVNFGTGVAVAVTCQGHVVEGAHGLSGEVGYWVSLRAQSWLESDTILESRIGGFALDRLAEAMGLASGTRSLAEAPDDSVKRVWRAVVAEMARTVANCVIMVDPASVALGGSIARNPDVVRAVQGAVRMFAVSPVHVSLSRLGDDAGLIGAALYVAQQIGLS